MSVITDAAIQACNQKATKDKVLENWVSSVILNVYQSTNFEKEGHSSNLFRIMRRLTKSGGSRTRSLVAIMTYIVPWPIRRIIRSPRSAEIVSMFLESWECHIIPS